MEPEEVLTPTELTPCSKKRKQTADAKAAAKLADPEGWKKKRAEQERQRQINKKARLAIEAVRQAAEDESTPPSKTATAKVQQVRATPDVATVTTVDHSLEMRKAFEHSIPLAVPGVEQALREAAANRDPELPASRPEPPPPEDQTVAEQLAAAERKIKSLEFDNRMLNFKLQDRDSELASFAGSLGRAVKEAEALRESCYSQSDRSLDEVAVDGRGVALHIPNSNSCHCPGCMGLMFLECPLRFKALYHARMQREQQ